MAKSTAVLKPNLGLYLDRPPVSLPPGALQDGLNFRVRLGTLSNLNLGWSLFSPTALNGPVTLIYTFITASGSQFLVLGTPTDLYAWNAGSLKAFYITPTYTTGTASASGTAVTGVGTLWNTTAAGDTNFNAKAGDQISFGSATVNDPAATWYTIQSVNSNTSITLTGSAGTIGSGAYTLRRRFTGTVFTTPWQVETFVDANPSEQDQLVLTNGVDNVLSWNGAALTVTKHTEFGFTCQVLCQYADMMVYGNVQQGVNYLGTTILNSDAGSPFNVGSASTGIANQFIVQGQPDPIFAMRRLGPYLGLYCQHNLIVANATGNALVFSFRIAASNKGILGHNAIATFPSNHQFIAADGMYTFDGSNVEPVNTHIWRNLLSSMDFIRGPNIFTYLDEGNGEQIWSVPQTTDPGSGQATSPGAFAWTEHYLEETAGQAQSALIASAMGINRPYSKRSFAFTAIGSYPNQIALTWDKLVNSWASYNYRWSDAFFSTSFPSILVGDTNGFLYQLNGAQAGNGVNLNSYITFGRRAVIDGRMRGLIRRIYPGVTPFPGTSLTITVGLADSAQATVLAAPTFRFSQTMTTVGSHFAPIYRRARYLDLGFGDATGAPWVIDAFDLDILPGGMR